MELIDWRNLSEANLDLLARHGNTPEIVAAALAEEERREEEIELSWASEATSRRREKRERGEEPGPEDY